MYLYKQGKKYLLKEDVSTPPKKEIVKSLLDVCESMRIKSMALDEICKIHFVDLPMMDTPIHKESYPYLRSILLKTIVKGVGFTDKNPSAVEVYKAAYKFWNQFDWVYTYDVSYENIIRKELGMNEIDGEKQMLLVPNCFNSITYVTVLSEEKYIPIDNKTEEVNTNPID